MIYYYYCDLLHFTIIASGNSSPHTGPVIGSITGVLVFLIIAAVIGVLVYRKSCKTKKEEKRSDINPEYGTYEVSDDPVAEVIENRDPKFCFTKSLLQVIDRNMDYGVVYEGRETSKTTDRNSDYGDYDYMS